MLTKKALQYPKPCDRCGKDTGGNSARISFTSGHSDFFMKKKTPGLTFHPFFNHSETMQFILSARKLNIPALTTLFWLIGLIPLEAQTARGNYNFLDFNQKPYYFGITLAYNTSNFKVFQSRDFILNDSIRRVESVRGPGFNLGIVTNLKIGEYFDIRFLPTLSFGERNINYASTNFDRRPFSRKVESVFVEMPFHARYKSAPYNDMRLFVIAGVKYSFDVASDSRSRQAETLVKIAPHDFAFEIGAGVQFFLPYFIFSPEIKFSHGLNNILIFDKNLVESSIIDKVLSRVFTLSLHFEG